MDAIKMTQVPALRNPVLIGAFSGWNDAADAATAGVTILIEHWHARRFADLDAEEFYDFTETRPNTRVVSGIQRAITWPENAFYACSAPNLPRDVVLVLGVEPHLHWRAFSDAIAQVCMQAAVTDVVLLGSLIADVPHTFAVPISGAASNLKAARRLQRLGIELSRYQGPTGIVGVLSERFQREGISVSSLWGATPHYLAASPNLKVTAALLNRLNRLLDLKLDLSDLNQSARRFEKQVSELVSRDPEAREYVQRLEERVQMAEHLETADQPSPASRAELPSADALIRHVEELLRRERNNGDSGER
jgi:proteasome assembly chaperone (PAC2) family protein